MGVFKRSRWHRRHFWILKAKEHLREGCAEAKRWLGLRNKLCNRDVHGRQNASRQETTQCLKLLGIIEAKEKWNGICEWCHLAQPLESVDYGRMMCGIIICDFRASSAKKTGGAGQAKTIRKYEKMWTLRVRRSPRQDAFRLWVDLHHDKLITVRRHYRNWNLWSQTRLRGTFV
jgi:hypothetical protein